MIDKLLGNRSEAVADLQSLKGVGGATVEVLRRSLKREIDMIDAYVSDSQLVERAVAADIATPDEAGEPVEPIPVYQSGVEGTVSLDPPDHPIIETPPSQG